MIGQSAFAGWLGYTATEKIAESWGASREDASDIALLGGLAVNIGVGIATADAPGLVVGPVVLTARRQGWLGSSNGPATPVVNTVNSIMSALSGSDGWALDPSLPDSSS
jgi:hypothetical protein